MKAALLPLLLLAAPAFAQDEDEAHRADRARTEALNTRSPNGYAPSAGARPTIRDSDDYAAAQADYRRRLANWRRRVSACEAGYYEACGR